MLPSLPPRGVAEALTCDNRAAISPRSRESRQAPGVRMLHIADRRRHLRAAVFAPRGRRRAGARHRHAWRAEAAAGLSRISPTSIRTLQRAAASCSAPSARSTASTRSSSRACAAQRHARVRHREPDGARARRAVHALRPYRRDASRCRRTAARSPSISIRKAHFSDGKPITADDVLFSLELLKEKGRPNHRTYYRQGGEGRAALGSRACASRSTPPATARCRSSSV